MIDRVYSPRLLPTDALWSSARVEIHAVGDGMDFLGVYPSIPDIATVESGRPQMESGTAMAERAIGLAGSTWEYHNSLLTEADGWLRAELDRQASDPSYVMNDDERLAAEMLGYPIPSSWDSYPQVAGSEQPNGSTLKDATIRRLCELGGHEIPSQDSPEYSRLAEQADMIIAGAEKVWSSMGVPTEEARR